MQGKYIGINIMKKDPVINKKKKAQTELISEADRHQHNEKRAYNKCEKRKAPTESMSETNNHQQNEKRACKEHNRRKAQIESMSEANRHQHMEDKIVINVTEGKSIRNQKQMSQKELLIKKRTDC